MRSTLIITGASGALGSWFVRDWLSQHPESHVIALCRSGQAASRCLQDLPVDSRSRLECRIADLTDAASLNALADTMPAIESATAVDRKSTV